MSPSFHARLVNGPFQDPGLLVSWAYHRRAVLFDLGDLSALSPGDLHKISHIFVTHTHMDHFIGFDQFVRLMLGRAKRVSIFGPQGFLHNVSSRLEGYTWNLVANYAESLVLDVFEVQPERCIGCTFDCRSGFRPTPETTRLPHDQVLCQDAEVKVSAVILDHGIPCLAFALQEPFHINIRKASLETLGLSTGPWLSRFKQLLYAKADPATRVQAPLSGAAGQFRTFALAVLTEQIAHITAGQKIAYVTDVAYTSGNVEKIIDLVKGADHLFIEASFLHREREIALAKQHLTARQAGLIAHQAHVKRMTVFHFSPRYVNRKDLVEEAQQAFEGNI
jgi:ribonuclease Z